MSNARAEVVAPASADAKMPALAGFAPASGGQGASPPGQQQGTAQPNGIRDWQFMHDVTQLKDLRSFLIRQAKSPQGGKLELGELNLLYYDKNGRLPTAPEWETLEHRSHLLYLDLPEPLRRKFLHGQIPRVVFRTAGVLGLVALGSLLGAFMMKYIHEPSNHPSIVVAFLVWSAALGGIGSITFIGMNALAVQDDVTFDITNKKLIALRVMLGALFGLVLTLPFGHGSFHSFIVGLQNHPPNPTADAPQRELQSILLLLPFVLGFSTTLVIMILNQFVEAIQSFFGKRISPPPAAADATAASPPVAGAPAGTPVGRAP